MLLACHTCNPLSACVPRITCTLPEDSLALCMLSGASQGLGEVLAKYLCSQGAKLILSSRSKEKLQVSGLLQTPTSCALNV